MASAQEIVFLNWLRENGAKIGKLDWPSVDPGTDSRGAIANKDIETGEFMLEIPSKLMMSPVDAFSDEDIGEILLVHKDMLRGDTLLTVYLMHERQKQNQSFYYPYIAILPEINNISEWTDDELALLQDSDIIARSHVIRRNLRTTFDRTVVKLQEQYPHQFSPEKFSFQSFVFCWFTIQARAFGRRLPWTALVPFADCLNHGNLQTKYDYNTENNQTFRLFPTGTNNYKMGCEVFNSYGRRPNDNLLLEYGFAMLDNEWDDLSLTLSLTKRLGLFDEKVAVISSFKWIFSRSYLFCLREFPMEALSFLRVCVCESLEELNYLQLKGKRCVVSLNNELRALQHFVAELKLFYIDLCRQSSQVADAELLQLLNRKEYIAPADDFRRQDRVQSAVVYRLTRKNIACQTINRLQIAIEILSAVTFAEDLVTEGSFNVIKRPFDDLNPIAKDLISAILLKGHAYSKYFEPLLSPFIEY